MQSSRKIARLRKGLAAVTAGVIAAFGALYSRGSLDWLENRTADFRASRTANPSKADPGIVLIDIDNASFQTLTADLGRWPWTREVWTRLLKYLAPGKPRMVLFDVLFTGSEPAADPGFAGAIAEVGPVLLPFAFTASHAELNSEASPPEKALVEVPGPFRGPDLITQEWMLNVPTAELARAMAASGSILGSADADGVTRRLPLVQRYRGKTYATYWLSAALHARGARTVRFYPGTATAGSARIPIDDRGNFVPRWNGTPANAYRRIPLMEMVCSLQPEICGPNVRRHPPSEFTGKIVLIGASAAGSYEVRPTPVAETAPGMFVLATGIDNLLNGDAVQETPRWLGWLILAFLCAIPALLVGTWREVTVPILLSGVILGGYGVLCFYLYGRGVWLPMMVPMVAAVVSLGGNVAYRYFTTDRELAKTRRTLEAYVSPQLVSYVMDNLESIRFDGQKRRLTILFSDVRGFSSISEHADPVKILEQLNEYFEAMTDIVFKHDGILDKFIGDGLMAHWGAFTPDRPNAELAARASLEMIEKLGELNQKWKSEGRILFDIGIGLNTADVIFGNVGAGKKLDFTVIGDGVNLAARLEGANKDYHTHIIISEFTLAELGGRAEVAPLGDIVVKGKTVPVEIYELKGLAPAPQSPLA